MVSHVFSCVNGHIEFRFSRFGFSRGPFPDFVPSADMGKPAQKKPAAGSTTPIKKPAAKSSKTQKLTGKNLAKHEEKQRQSESEGQTPPEELSLDEKIANFEKKPRDVSSFLGSLNKEERERVWKRFEYARQSDKELQNNYTRLAFIWQCLLCWVCCSGWVAGWVAVGGWLGGWVYCSGVLLGSGSGWEICGTLPLHPPKPPPHTYTPHPTPRYATPTPTHPKIPPEPFCRGCCAGFVGWVGWWVGWWVGGCGWLWVGGGWVWVGGWVGVHGVGKGSL